MSATKSKSSFNDVEPSFLAADGTLESLYEALTRPDSHYSACELRTSLEEQYSRGNDETRYKIVTELIEMEYAGARSLLVKALRDDPSPLIRHEAAFGLGILRHPGNVASLVEALLCDRNLMVRHEAAIALAELGDEGCIAALDEATRDPAPEVALSAKYAIQNVRLRHLQDW